MYIAIALKKLLEDRDSQIFMKTGDVHFRAICQMDDQITVKDHIWLASFGTKIDCMDFKRTGNPVLDAGRLSGTLLGLPANGVLVTDDPTLLATGKFEQGKFSLSFAKDIRSALSMLGAKKKATTKRATRKTADDDAPSDKKDDTRTEKDSAATTQEADKQELVNETPQADVPKKDLFDAIPKPVDPADEVDPVLGEETAAEIENKGSLDTSSVLHAEELIEDLSEEKIMSEDVISETIESESAVSSTVANFKQASYDQNDRANAKVYPDDFPTGHIDFPGYEAFRNELLKNEVKQAMAPYVLTAFQTSKNSDELFERLMDVVADSNELSDIYVSTARNFEQLKALADAVAPVNAII